MHVPDGFINAPVSAATGLISLGTIWAYIRNAKNLVADHDVQLADVAEVPVQGLHDAVYELVYRELVLVLVHPDDEEQGGVPPVYDLHPPMLDDRALLIAPRQALAHPLPLHLPPLGFWHDLIVVREPGLALLVDQQHEPHSHLP